MLAIETNDLCKSYGKRRGISDVNISVEQGEIFGFLGPNGAGKSTTIRVLLGFLKATAGRSRILGKDCWSESDVIKADVGYVAGDVRLYSWLTARRAFQIVSEIRQRDIAPRGFELAERFRLEVDLPVRKMSRGNRQKVALVTALAHSPRLVILDEPTSGLDPLMQDTLMLCLREMAEQGHTVFFSSHTLSEVDSLCDRVAIVRDGRIAACEPLQQLKARAPRRVSLIMNSAQDAGALQLPEFATLASRQEARIEFELVGSAAELTRWAASLNIKDIAIGQPNLESLFRQYYQTETATS
ncbi:MAG: ABC transporter ATP-binding protein [Planctomycetaceae bacterium]|nr:ABC transporter ATP-binding protein [Planctomycetaceae bacterium]